MSLELLSEPAVSPVSVVEVKEYLQIGDNNEDALFDSFIKAATKAVENFTGRALINQSWRQLFIKPKLPLVLLKRPVRWIGTIRYLENGEDYIWEESNYELLAYKVEAKELPGQYIYVDYRSGYGDNQEDVPADIKQVIKLLVGYWYQNRGELASLPDGFKKLLTGYRSISY